MATASETATVGPAEMVQGREVAEMAETVRAPEMAVMGVMPANPEVAALAEAAETMAEMAGLEGMPDPTERAEAAEAVAATAVTAVREETALEMVPAAPAVLVEAVAATAATVETPKQAEMEARGATEEAAGAMEARAGTGARQKVALETVAMAVLEPHRTVRVAPVETAGAPRMAMVAQAGMAVRVPARETEALAVTEESVVGPAARVGMEATEVPHRVATVALAEMAGLGAMAEAAEGEGTPRAQEPVVPAGLAGTPAERLGMVGLVESEAIPAAVRVAPVVMAATVDRTAALRVKAARAAPEILAVRTAIPAIGRRPAAPKKRRSKAGR
ncbi:MAG: hypothetical protein KF841_04800 [Phycisphaerae bacterium]|nr:hypothetical protein [Phycisphaerae bacterium]